MSALKWQYFKIIFKLNSSSIKPLFMYCIKAFFLKRLNSISDMAGSMGTEENCDTSYIMEGNFLVHKGMFEPGLYIILIIDIFAPPLFQFFFFFQVQ